MRRNLFGIIAMTVVTVAGGCGTKMEVPAGFVPLDQFGDYDVRAVSADGVVIGRKTEDNPENGTIEFWAEAIQIRLAARTGYKLSSSDAVESLYGTPGRLLTWDVDRSGAPYRYMLAVFVDGKDVILAEAGGPVEAFKKHAGAIRLALLSVR